VPIQEQILWPLWASSLPAKLIKDNQDNEDKNDEYDDKNNEYDEEEKDKDEDK